MNKSVADFKVKTWGGAAVNGPCIITKKIDGVQITVREGLCYTKGDKLVEHLGPFHTDFDGVYELFYKDWGNSISMLRSTADVEFEGEMMYSISEPDPRLVMSYNVHGYSVEEIQKAFETARQEGHEGLVLRGKHGMFKVKNKSTYDVKIQHVTLGKREGQAGAFITAMGKVPIRSHDLKGDAFAYPDRFIGRIIEVSCMELTANGRFRQPELVRFREDKDSDSNS